ncbi:MAG: glycosyltransferase [Bacteroidota bacterium]
MKLSIIIVNYNVRYFLEQALLSVQKATKSISAEVFVVDNNSVDDSVRMVAEKFPNVHLIANKNNPGFSKANNQAIRLASGEYILLLNPDTLVEEDTFEKCLTFMDAHPKAGALGVKMIDGSGNFLPESKRGLPTPMTAFYKTFGLAKFFPKSPIFNRYHLGFLDPNQTHEVAVLAGAFMWLRKSVLDEIGLLDETFFMYGEDIDLSYRVTKAGYKNYYFADARIIHYKGESTKKGSLNYVKVFYNAMIIFAKKHFQGEKATLFVGILQLAIYFRALLTVLGNFFKKAYLPILDGLLIFVGMYWLKDFWATSYFDDPNYYRPSFLYFNVPLYTTGWLGSIYFNGGYDDTGSIRKSFKGLVVGSILLAAIYGFLPLTYRTSRMLLLLGSVWAIVSTSGLRLVLHFLQHKNLKVGQRPIRNLVIVGEKMEAERAFELVNRASIAQNFIGFVSSKPNRNNIFLSHLANLKEVVSIYKINEIIFCSKDVSAQSIMSWMTKLGNKISYKIVPPATMSIIGSNSKNTPGELFTVDIRYQISEAVQQRSKRLLDVVVAFLLIIIYPIAILFVRQKWTFLKNIFQVTLGQKTWVGYAEIDENNEDLPPIRQGVLSPLEGFDPTQFDLITIRRLNFFYARDFDWAKDLALIWKGFRHLGR